MNQKKSLTPQSVRSLLGFLLFVLIAGGAAIFYFGLEQLKDYSVKVNQELAAADAAEKQVDNLRALKSALADSTNLIAKADSLFSTPATYRAQLDTDIKNHAAAAGVSIDGVAFDDAGASQGRYLATVQLNKTVDYEKFIKFLDGIETNIPKMQVDSLTINRVETDKNAVAVSNLQLKVAVR